MPGLLLLRHAQSMWNEAGRWQGWADPPLSVLGEQQIQRAAGHLAGAPPFDLVVSSDLLRARRTAELLAEALGQPGAPAVEPGLREYNIGAWSGRTHEEIEARWPGEIARFGRGEIAAPPGGEHPAEFDARVAAAGNRVAAAAHAAGADRVLVVAHGGVLRTLARAAGQAEYRVGHLAGYWGEHAAGGLFPDRPVDLLDGEIVPDSGEATAGPGL
jgi:broad specificity phosphatase PhoE